MLVEVPVFNMGLAVQNRFNVAFNDGPVFIPYIKVALLTMLKQFLMSWIHAFLPVFHITKILYVVLYDKF